MLEPPATLALRAEPRRPRGAAPELPRRSRASSAATPAACGWCATASRRRSAGGHHEVAARGYCNLAELLYRDGRLDELEACVARGPGVHARARVLVARLQPRGAPLRAAAAPRRLRRRARGAARAGRRRRGPGDAVRLQRAVARPRCWRGAATRRPAALLAGAWERAQRQRLLLGLAYAGLALRRVGVAGRAAGGRRARSRRRCSRGSRTPARRRSAASSLRYLARAGLRRRAVRRLPGAVGGRPARRLAGGRGGVGGARATLRAGAGAGRAGDAGRVAEGLRILDAAGRRRPRPLARARGCAQLGVRVPRGPRRGHAREPRRAHRAPARRARAAQRGADERARSPSGSCSRCAPSTTTSRRCWTSSACRSRREAAGAARRLGTAGRENARTCDGRGRRRAPPAPTAGHWNGRARPCRAPGPRRRPRLCDRGCRCARCVGRPLCERGGRRRCRARRSAPASSRCPRRCG